MSSYHDLYFLKFSNLKILHTLGNPGLLELPLPETLVSTASGDGIWELQSKNIWVTKGWEPLL